MAERIVDRKDLVRGESYIVISTATMNGTDGYWQAEVAECRGARSFRNARPVEGSISDSYALARSAAIAYGESHGISILDSWD